MGEGFQGDHHWNIHDKASKHCTFSTPNWLTSHLASRLLLADPEQSAQGI